MRAARAQAIEEDNARTEKRNAALEEAKNKWGEEWLAKKAEEAAQVDENASGGGGEEGKEEKDE